MRLYMVRYKKKDLKRQESFLRIKLNNKEFKEENK
jgi:hypothetical protein